MAQENISSLVAAIKEEINSTSSVEHTAANTEIKTEHDQITLELTHIENHHNPFENIQLEIKQEVNIPLDVSHEKPTENLNTINSADTSMMEMVIKTEKPMDETLVSYDYPHFDDNSMDDGSMDSNEATAFPNVEACLQEELNIKSEIEVDPSIDKKEIEHEAKDVKMPSSEKETKNPNKGGRPRKPKRGRPKTSHETRAEQRREANALYQAKQAGVEASRRSSAKYAAAHPEVNRRSSARYAAAHPEVSRRSSARYAAAHPEVSRRSSAKYAAAHPEVSRRSSAKYAAAHPEVSRRSSAKYAAAHPEVSRRSSAKYAAAHPEVSRRSSAKYAAAHPEVNRRAVAKYAAAHPEVNRRAVAKYVAAHSEVNRRAVAKRKVKKPALENNSAEFNKQELPYYASELSVGSYRMLEDYSASASSVHKVYAEQYAAVLKTELEECDWNIRNVEYGKIRNEEHEPEPDHEMHLTPIASRIVSNIVEQGNVAPRKFTRRSNRSQIKAEQSNEPENGMGSVEFQLNSITGNEGSFEHQNYNDQLPSFQLNSITGNVLSLEQEAYGLLKTKKKSKITEGIFQCPECPKTYSKKSGLRAHTDVHRTIERRAMGVVRGLLKRKENQKKKMNGANYEYVAEEANLKTNLKKEGYKCTCGQVFQRRSRMETCLRSHNLFESHTNCVSCMTCTKQFTNKDELALHRKRLHRKKFPCKFCPTDYDTRKELFKHLQIHQKVQLTEYKVISEVMNGKQKLRCFLCSKTWTELTELKIHVMNTHKGPYCCPHCKSTFPKIVDFGNHIKTYHPEVEGQCVLDVLEAFSKLIQSWKCEECELQFLEADKLALHQIEKHSPDLKAQSQFQCTDCRRVFISQKGLTSHRRIHHNTEAKEEENKEIEGIMCLECRKMCKDITALTSHMRLHSPERKYPCKFCDFRFATPEKRKAHADIHTGDMKYVCFICEYQCSSENRLKQHKLSLKHANMKEYLLTGKPLLEEESTSKEKIKKKEENIKKRKKYKAQEKVSDSSSGGEICCDVCGEKFENESKMLEHKQTHPFIEIFNDDKPSRIFFK